MTNFWHNLKRPFFALAPMEDVSNCAFRELLTHTNQPDVMFTEFTSVDGLVSVGKLNVEGRLEFTERQRPVVAQIWGTKPDNFYEVAKMLKKLNFDGIDLNTGCPHKKIMKVGGGAALIGKNELVADIVSAVRHGAPDMPLSIKTRLGIKENIVKAWLTFLLSLKLEAITLHARTAHDMSKKPAAWEFIKTAVALRNELSPETTIIGNGDVKNYSEGLGFHENFGCDGIMIGRGVLTDLWCFGSNDTKTKSMQEKKALFLKHIELYENFELERRGFDVFKKFIKAHFSGSEDAVSFRSKLLLAKNLDEMRGIINE